MNSTDVVVSPPFVYIDQVKNSLTDRIEIAAQNSWIGKGGAFTGEIRLESLTSSMLVLCFYECRMIYALGLQIYLFVIVWNRGGTVAPK